MSSRRPEDPPSTFEVTLPESQQDRSTPKYTYPEHRPDDILRSDGDFFQLSIYRPRGEDKTEVIVAELIDFVKGGTFSTIKCRET